MGAVKRACTGFALSYNGPERRSPVDLITRLNQNQKSRLNSTTSSKPNSKNISLFGLKLKCIAQACRDPYQLGRFFYKSSKCKVRQFMPSLAFIFLM